MNAEKIDNCFWANLESWSVNDAENVIVGYNKRILSAQGITDFSAIDSYLQKFDDSIIAFIDKRILVQVRGEDGYAELDGNGNEVYDLDRKRTQVNIKDFISWAYREGIPLPAEVIDLLATKNPSVAGSVDDSSILDVSEDVKYIKIKGVNFENLTSDKFTEIKKYYGMLQNEESKYRRALPIAVKIGLLFYERSLGKPTTRPAYLEAYKQEFDSILKNDSLAKEIYSYLPEEYRGGVKTLETSVEILPTIKAAVYAGSIYDIDDAKDLDKLKRELAEFEYQIPPDDILAKIIEAVKAI